MAFTQHIAASLGQRNMAEALGVGVTAVSNAVVRGSFPASWYPVIRDMCRQAGIDCPERAFNFKSPESRPSTEAAE